MQRMTGLSGKWAIRCAQLSVILLVLCLVVTVTFVLTIQRSHDKSYVLHSNSVLATRWYEIDDEANQARLRYEREQYVKERPYFSCADSSRSLPFITNSSVVACEKPNSTFPTVGLGYSIVINGTFQLDLPVTSSQFEVLKSFAQRSNVGYDGVDVLKPELRQSHEILASSMSLSRWFGVELFYIENNVVENLMPSMYTPAQMRLHKLLIYEVGDFFVPHHDAYHTEDQVATLIMLLPTTPDLAFTGGTLRVQRGEDHFMWQSSD